MITPGRLLVGFEGTRLPARVEEMARTGLLAGVVLFARNVVDPDEWRSLIADIVAAFAASELPPIVAVDQEGGPVQRLKPPAIPAATRIPAMGALRELFADEEFEALGAAMGTELAALGVNVDFAPVLDVDSNPENPIIGQRAFGTTPTEVIARGIALARGLGASGIAWCAKHFPGHGDTSLDSHLALPRLAHGRARLDAVELPPFAAAVEAGAPLVMTAHVVFDALDPAHPATLSPEVVPRVLRTELGYDGVVVTDDLDMLAIRDHYDASAVARGLSQADIDLALVCHDLDFALEVARGLPESKPARRRIEALRARLGWPRVDVLPPFPAALRDRMSACFVG